MLASFVVGGLVALSLTLGGVAQAQSSCDAAITKAAGKKVACKLKVIAKAQKTGATADPVKLAKCETKFDSSCTKAQGQGDCNAQTQLCDAIEVRADACVDSLSGAFTGAVELRRRRHQGGRQEGDVQAEGDRGRPEE